MCIRVIQCSEKRKRNNIDDGVVLGWRKLVCSNHPLRPKPLVGKENDLSVHFWATRSDGQVAMDGWNGLHYT